MTAAYGVNELFRPDTTGWTSDDWDRYCDSLYQRWTDLQDLMDEVDVEIARAHEMGGLN